MANTIIPHPILMFHIMSANDREIPEGRNWSLSASDQFKPRFSVDAKRISSSYTTVLSHGMYCHYPARSALRCTVCVMHNKWTAANGQELELLVEMRSSRWQENLTAGRSGLISQRVITSKPILRQMNELSLSFCLQTSEVRRLVSMLLQFRDTILSSRQRKYTSLFCYMTRKCSTGGKEVKVTSPSRLSACHPLLCLG